MKPKRVLAVSSISTLLALSVVVSIPSEYSPPSRTFLFTYHVALKAIPTSAQRVRIWFPRPASDKNQTVVLKRINGPVPLRETRESAFGNQILYGELSHPASGSAEFTTEYQVTRKEFSKGGFEDLAKADEGTAGTLPPNTITSSGPWMPIACNSP